MLKSATITPKALQELCDAIRKDTLADIERRRQEGVRLAIRQTAWQCGISEQELVRVWNEQPRPGLTTQPADDDPEA